MKLIPRSLRGISLIELLLYITVLSAVLLMLAMFLSFLVSSRIKNQSIADVNQQGLQVMQLVTQTIRNAKTIDFPGIGATSSSLSMTMHDPFLSPTVFESTSGTVTIKEGSSEVIPLTNSHVAVSDLVFQNISSITSTERVVRISFTVDYKNTSGRNENSFTKSFIGSATLRQ